MWFAAPLPPLSMAAGLAIVFGAGIVRGFAGFGFSALGVAGLALLVSPAQVMPAIFVLEVLASARSRACRLSGFAATRRTSRC